VALEVVLEPAERGGDARGDATDGEERGKVEDAGPVDLDREEDDVADAGDRARAPEGRGVGVSQSVAVEDGVRALRERETRTDLQKMRKGARRW